MARSGSLGLIRTFEKFEDGRDRVAGGGLGGAAGQVGRGLAGRVGQRGVLGRRRLRRTRRWAHGLRLPVRGHRRGAVLQRSGVRSEVIQVAGEDQSRARGSRPFDGVTKHRHRESTPVSVSWWIGRVNDDGDISGCVDHVLRLHRISLDPGDAVTR